MTKFLCGECIHNSDKGGGCLIPKNLGYVDNCNRYLPKDRPIVQTNEEYLRSCNTEQLAEEIVNLTLLDKYKLYDKMESAEYDIGIGVGAKKVIVEWLKQPHTIKE